MVSEDLKKNMIGPWARGPLKKKKSTLMDDFCFEMMKQDDGDDMNRLIHRSISVRKKTLEHPHFWVENGLGGGPNQGPILTASSAANFEWPKFNWAVLSDEQMSVPDDHFPY